MTSESQIQTSPKRTESNILAWLAYFDIFEHPLREEELYALAGTKIGQEEFTEMLEELIQRKMCFRFNGYVGLNNEIDRYVDNRMSKEKEAGRYFSKLPFYARLISHFPYVKALAISGSLSKNVIHEDGDIDYFVITSEGRLWICRTFLILFKKIFLLNSKKYFCINYFVDERNLKIPDENIYTAVEISYLLPVYNSQLIDEMKQTNGWTQSYLPQFQNPIRFEEVKSKFRPMRLVEFLLNGRHGDYLDLYLMRGFHSYWRRKFKHFSLEKFELTMRTNRGISKHHPQNFQQKVLDEYEGKLQKLSLDE